MSYSLQDKEIFDLIHLEQTRQQEGLELIASENFVSPQIYAAVGSVLTNKYAEGLPGKRYYGGCKVVDEVEELAIVRAKELFGAAWVNVQPHSGSQANAAVMLAVLKPGDTILGFDLSHGGHLTHGAAVNFSGKLYNASFYGVHRHTAYIDYDTIATLALEKKPKLIISGGSSYSRDWDYIRLRKIANEVGAFLLTDMAHTAGLIASKLLNDPLPHAHFVTTTTHKTLRGPRGGMILMGQDFDNPFNLQRKGSLKPMSAILDSGVFPGTQGGPLMHVIAGKAVAFGLALQESFVTYSKQVIQNTQSMVAAFLARGYQVVSGGSDNHLLLLDLRKQGLTGLQAQQALGKAGITVNRNTIPFDERSAFVTSGIRLGTPAVTTRGLVESDMRQVVTWIDKVLQQPTNKKMLAEINGQVQERMSVLPLFT